MKSIDKKGIRIIAYILSLVLCVAPLFSMTVSATDYSGINEATGQNIAPLVCAGEYTDIFYIPIADPVTRSIYNLEVSLTGNTSTKTVSATIKNTAALGYSTIDVEIALYSERYSTVLRDSAYDSDLNLFESLTVTHSGVYESAKYYAVVTGVANGQPIYYSTDRIPFNKNASKYPTYISSPVTGQRLPFNFSMTMSKVPESSRVTWNSSNKNAYANYLGVSLAGYDVHHIVPRAYGGTNAYSNLIPLTSSDHTTVTSWWAGY